MQEQTVATTSMEASAAAAAAPRLFANAHFAKYNTFTAPLFSSRSANTLTAMSAELLASGRRSQCIVEPTVLVAHMFPDNCIFSHFSKVDGRGKPRALSIEGFLEHISPPSSTHLLRLRPSHRRISSAGSTNVTTPDEGPKYDWRLPDLTKASQEEGITNFFNALVEAAHRHGGFPIGPLTVPDRYWSSGYKNVPLAGLDALRKPDIMCLDHGCTIPDWRAVHTVLEVKSGTLKPSDIYAECRERANCIYRVQDCRRYVVVAALVKSELTIARFDRGGFEVARAFDINDNKTLFLQFLLGMSLASRDCVGYDQTIVFTGPSRYITSQHLRSIDLHFTAFITRRMESRGSVVWLGSVGIMTLLDALPKHLNLMLNSPVVAKTVWHDDTNSITEGIILALLEKKGVQGIPRLICEERVTAPGLDIGDSTTLIRAQLGLSDDKIALTQTALRNARLNGEAQVTGYEPRSHVRLFTTPWGIPILQFRSGVEMLGIFVDTLTCKSFSLLLESFLMVDIVGVGFSPAHEQATGATYVNNSQPFPFRVLHRDPSPTNLGMVPQTLSTFPEDPNRPGQYRGLLFDWGFTSVASIQGNPSSDYDDNASDEDVSEEEDVLMSTITIPADAQTCDSGLVVADPNVISDMEVLTTVVQKFIEEDNSHQDITGTRPYMSIEMLLRSLPLSECRALPEEVGTDETSHEAFHDLEAFYFVLLYMCIQYQAPHAAKRDQRPDHISRESMHSYVPDWMNTWMGGEDTNLTGIKSRWVRFCTETGLRTFVEPELSPYFSGMISYLEEIRFLLYGSVTHWSNLYPRPLMQATHQEVIAILRRAMVEIPLKQPDFGVLREPPPNFYPPIDAYGKWMGEANLTKYQPPLRINTTYVPAMKVSESEGTSTSIPSSASYAGVWAAMRQVKPPSTVATYKKLGLESSYDRWYTKHKDTLYKPFQPKIFARRRYRILQLAARKKAKIESSE